MNNVKIIYITDVIHLIRFRILFYSPIEWIQYNSPWFLQSIFN